jgi:voltage-dependent calcium channel
VENFSYVFQVTGGSKSITREEMRSFKKVWAEFANQKTGYLERNHFVPFFAVSNYNQFHRARLCLFLFKKLSGIFEVRIYPTELSIPNIMAASQSTPESEYARPSKVVAGVDLTTLHRVLGNIDYASVRKRRLIYSRLYHEASISHQHGRGISFTDMLFMLAHHKLIVDRDALVYVDTSCLLATLTESYCSLKDLVIRTETNKLVTDLVNLDRVRSLLKMISHRRRFLSHREQLRMMRMGQQGNFDLTS